MRRGDQQHNKLRSFPSDYPHSLLSDLVLLALFRTDDVCVGVFVMV